MLLTYNYYLGVKMHWFELLQHAHNHYPYHWWHGHGKGHHKHAVVFCGNAVRSGSVYMQVMVTRCGN